MTEEYRGYTIDIEQDENPESPREWDNLGTMAYKSREYILGDEKIPEYYYTDSGDERYIDSVSKVEEYLRTEKNAFIMLPLYVYEHSGITMRTSSFSDRWDSGQTGYIYVTKEKIRSEYNCKRITKAIQAKVIQVLQDEVKTFAQYLEGDIYGYSVSSDKEAIDSCWGFYGYDEALNEAKSIVDWHAVDSKKKRIDKISTGHKIY